VHWLFGHAAPVRAAAITSDGRRVVSVSADGTFQAWDTATRAGICSERIPRGACAVAVTSDGLRTVIGFGDGTREVWNLPRRVNWYTLNGNGHSASAIAVTSDGRRIFSAFADGTLRVSDLKGPDYRERTLGGEQKEVCAVVMTSDGQHGISASCDGTLKVWNLEQLKEEKTLVGRQRGIRALAMAPNDCNALFISADGTLRVWDLRTGREGRTLNDDPAWVHAVAMTPNGGQIVLAHANGRLEVCNAWHKKQVLRGHRDWVRAVAMTPHASRVVSTSSDGLLKIWDLATGEELFSQEGHAKARALATTGDGDCIISGYSDGRLKIWKLQQGVNAIEIQDERTLIGHSHWVCAVAITPDGRRAVSAAPSDIPSSSSQDGLELKVWNPRTGEEERDLSRPFDDHWVYAMAITPSGRRAFMAVADGRVRVLNLVNSGRLPSIPDVPARDPPREVRAIAFSARAHPGNELILVCSDGTIEKLRLRRNRETREFQWQGDRHSTKDWQRAVRDPVPELGRPFPYDEEAVLKAVHAQQIDQAEDEKSGWDRLAHLRCSAALRDIVAGYNLDELCGPDEPPDADPRRDAIAAEMRNKVKGQIRKWGLQLIGGGIGNLDPPDKVINQRIVHWQAHLQTEIKMLEAQAEAESRRMIERSRAGAERELIERISEINEQLQRLDPQRRKGVLALRVIAAIEQSATTAGDSGSQDQTSSGDVTPLV
jgi:WD40 repeat protein